MNRRDFCSLSATGLALAPFVLQGAAIPSRPTWKTAIGLNGFASGTRKYQSNYPIWEVLRFAHDHGFDGIELVDGWPSGGYPSLDDESRCEALLDLYIRYELEIFSIQMGAGGAFSPDAEERTVWLEHFRQRAKLANFLGCDCIGMWPGGGLRGSSIGEAIGHLSKSFSEAARIGEQMGLIVAFEIEPPFVFNTESHLTQILEFAKESPLKTIYDPSHFDLMNGSSGRPHEMVKRIGVDRIGYVHLTDCDGTLREGGTSKHLACGDGHVDIAASLSLLHQGGFNGWMMIDEWEIPDPYDACLKGLRAIEKAKG